MLSENIVRYRKLLGLTRKEFSDKTGISISFMQSLELGESILSYDKLLEVTDYLHLPLDYFIGDENRFEKTMTILLYIEYLSDKNGSEVNDALGKIFTAASNYG